MTWMNHLQLEKKYKDSYFLKDFQEFFTLHLFFKNSLVSSEYKPPDLFNKAIKLTPEGKKLLSIIQKAIKDISLPEIKLAIFIVFSHQELFIDLNTSDKEIIHKLLNSEILGGNIKYPWVFERLLYDKFFDMFPALTKELSYEETIELLEKTPNGVFQVRNVVVGPFGVLNSAFHRMLVPNTTAPLWHCSDPSCETLHPVQLSPGKCRTLEAVDVAFNELSTKEGISSEWDHFYYQIVRDTSWYDDMYLWRFPFLLANAFSEIEIRNILKRLLEKHSKELRDRFPESKRFKDILSGSADKISKALIKPECFQLILLMPNDIIVENIEFLIDEKVINIPSTEKRTEKVSYGPSGWLRLGCECSRFGIRSVSMTSNIALARLKRLLQELYIERDRIKDLKWKLKYISGETIYEMLDKYLHTKDPKNIVTDLVLSGSDYLEQTIKTLCYGRFVSPSSQSEEERLVDKILWKLGFEVGLFPSYQRLFWERLENFLEVVCTNSYYTERVKESIRSVGANFFVSLEEVLDYSLSFITWTLLSDHYGVTKYKCNFDDARSFMVSKLNGRKLGSKEFLKLDAKGRNTLYPLIQGFSALAKLCGEIIKKSKNKLKRSKNDLPGYYNKTKLEYFPFIHTVLILDLGKNDHDKIITLLKEITAMLEKSQICDIRNRIEHKRKDFPNQEEIINACNMVKDTLSKIENEGICPSIYFLSKKTGDNYGRGTVEFKDYKGREIVIQTPSNCRGCRLPSILHPQIIVPCIHIGDSYEIMRFKFQESSDYVKMWEQYPKRKLRITPKEKD